MGGPHWVHVFGGVPQERIVLDEYTLLSGGATDWNNPDA